MLEIKQPIQEIDEVIVLKATCEKCGYNWETVKSNKKCPKCKTEDWHTNKLD